MRPQEAAPTPLTTRHYSVRPLAAASAASKTADAGGWNGFRSSGATSGDETDPDVIGCRPFMNARLVALEDRYVPASLFGLNQNIRPSRSAAVPCVRLRVVNLHADSSDKKPQPHAQPEES